MRAMFGICVIAVSASLLTACSFEPELTGVICSGAGECPPGLSCNSATNTCQDSSLPSIIDFDCESDFDCEDGLACTSDFCSEGICVFVPDDPETCGAGATCVAGFTHSLSQDIDENSGIACSDTGDTGFVRDNRWMRVYRLENFGATSFTVEAVDVGIETAVSGTDGTQPASIAVYSTTVDPPSFGDMTLLASADFTVFDSDALSVKTVFLDTPAFIAPGQLMVVEWSNPDGLAAGHTLFPGGNAQGQTDDTYVSSIICDLVTPVTYASIGFPDDGLVLDPLGQASGAICSQ